MPHVRIEIVKGRSLEERRRLFQAVHDALKEAFRIPDDDRTQRIVEHEPAYAVLLATDRYPPFQLRP